MERFRKWLDKAISDISLGPLPIVILWGVGLGFGFGALLGALVLEPGQKMALAPIGGVAGPFLLIRRRKRLIRDWISEETASADENKKWSGAPRRKVIGIVVHCAHKVGYHSGLIVEIGEQQIVFQGCQPMPRELAESLETQAVEHPVSQSFQRAAAVQEGGAKVTAGGDFRGSCAHCEARQIAVCEACGSYFCSAPVGLFKTNPPCPACGNARTTDGLYGGLNALKALRGVAVDDESQASGQAGSDGFGFDESAWEGQAGENEKAAGSNDEADYAQAMREAMEKVNSVSDAKAEATARRFETMAQEAGLPKRTRMHYQLIAMLLNERAKGFRGTPDPTPPSDEEIKALLLTSS